MTTHKDDVELSDEDTIVPPSYKLYWKSIRNWRDASGRRLVWKSYVQPHRCDICDQMDDDLAKYEDVRKRAVEATKAGSNLRSTPEYIELCKEFYLLSNRKVEIDRHLRHQDTQRVYLQQRELELPRRTPGNFRMIVYEDYVAQYSATGNKSSNLVFTIIWRDEGGELRRKYVDNYLTDRSSKQDSYLTTWMWTAHLKANLLHMALKKLKGDQSDGASGQRAAIMAALQKMPTEFVGVTHILRTGDSGSHFQSVMNFLWEISVHSNYGIFLESHTLCKRHAWSLCDSH